MYLKIKEIRKNKNLTQEQLASKIDVSVRQFSDYEKQIADIPLKKLKNIDDVLDCSIFDLIQLSEEEENVLQKNNDIFHTLNEPEETYGSNNLVKAQAKTIAILEKQVDDLIDTNKVLKDVIRIKL